MRVKLGYFDECFPGTNGMTDLDGFLFLAETNEFVFMEWKSNGVGVNGKQAKAMEALSYIGLVFIIHGAAETMDIKAWRILDKGKYGEVSEDVADLKKALKWRQELTTNKES